MCCVNLATPADGVMVEVCDTRGSSLFIGLTVQVCDTCRKLSEAQVLHGSGGDQRFLRVVQDVSQRVHSYVEVGDVHAHGLFTHRRLVRVPGRLHNIKIKFYYVTEKRETFKRPKDLIPGCGRGRG